MKELEVRKQLLILESGLNRAHLVADAAAIGTGARALSRQADSASSLVASSVVLATGLVNSPRRKSAGAGDRSSILHSAIKGVSLIVTLWLAYLAQKKGSTDS
jgi:hypothetical protein